MLRRRTPDQPAQSETPLDLTKAAGKGRPTPTRREAESRRRTPVAAPRTKGERKDQVRANRLATRQALRSGDESRLPARDRGPVRRFTRDFVDARRGVAEWFLPAAIILYAVGAAARHSRVATYTSEILLAMLVWLIGELTFTGFLLRRQLGRRFDAKETRGAIFYGVTRATTLRRLRLPKPGIRPGEKPRN